MNFTNFPPFDSFNFILVVVQQLTKMVHFFFCTKVIIKEKTTDVFSNHVFQYHGPPLEEIICDVDHTLHPSYGNSLSY
jgi:hypothetical protein